MAPRLSHNVWPHPRSVRWMYTMIAESACNGTVCQQDAPRCLYAFISRCMCSLHVSARMTPCASFHVCTQVKPVDILSLTPNNIKLQVGGCLLTAAVCCACKPTAPAQPHLDCWLHLMNLSISEPGSIARYFVLMGASLCLQS